MNPSPLGPEQPVQITHLGTESGKTGCPTLKQTDRDTYLVQGWKVVDPRVLREFDIPAHETVVEVPAALLHNYLPDRAPRSEAPAPAGTDEHQAAEGA